MKQYSPCGKSFMADLGFLCINLILPHFFEGKYRVLLTSC
jgi:hypothetical protein